MDVLYRRSDGFHEVETILQSISLHDGLLLEDSEFGVTVRSTMPGLPIDEENLAGRAARALIDRLNLKKGVSIEIQKRIPVGAGLGGGSADAAATLVGLNRLWGLYLSIEELRQMAEGLGADVPFCLEGGTAMGRGKGEILEPLPPLEGMWMVLVKPKVSVSTAEVYRNIDILAIQKRPKTEQMVKAIERRDVYEISAGLCNVLETVTARMYPEIGFLKEELVGAGALGAAMSGSGPTVFGVTSGESDALRICDKFLDMGREAYISRSILPGDSFQSFRGIF